MQAQGAAQRGGVGTIPGRGGRWLEAVLTVAAILVIVALMTRGEGVPTDTGGVGAQDANKAGVVGSAVVHDDAGNVHSGLAGYAPVHDDTGIMHASMVKDMGQMRGTDPGKGAPLNAGAAVIHDDAGNVR